MDNITASAAAWGPNRLDVFGVGGDGALYHKAWTGAEWTPGWDDLGGQFTSAPAVAAWGPNPRTSTRDACRVYLAVTPTLSRRGLEA
jgi:Repeat of unknown function (DUF346)